MATKRGMHRVITNAVHAVLIPTSSPASTEGIELGWILLLIFHFGYAYYPLAVSSCATRSTISPFAAQELSTAGVQTTIRDFLHCTVLARDAE